MEVGIPHIPPALASKGVATNGNPALLGSLKPDWMHAWCNQLNWLPNVPAGIEIVPHLYRKILSPDEVKQIAATEGWKGYLILFNEPDLENDLAPSQVTNRMVLQMKSVLDVYPDPKFIIAGGTQDHALWTDTPYLRGLWQLIPKELKEFIAGIHTHLYPQWFSPARPCTYDVAREYFQKWRNSLNDFLPARELWITEFGTWNTKYIAEEEYRRDNEWEAIGFASVMRAAANGLCDKVCWFSMWEMLPDGYHYLQEKDGTLTCTGKAFAQS